MIQEGIMLKEFVIEHYKSKNLPLDSMIMCGIRNEANFELDRFNDWELFIYKNEISIAKATTDPGVYYTKYPMNPKGAIHMDNGFHKDIWRLRKHRNKYLALCNDEKCNKVRGWRDSNPNNLIYGWFCTNWHTTKQEEFIKMASAGCQVTPDQDFFNLSIKMAQACGQKRWSYNIFKIKEIPIEIIYSELAIA